MGRHPLNPVTDADIDPTRTTMASVDEHAVRIHGPGGAEATIAFLGATVSSFIPEDGEERFFKSSKSPLSGPKAIRGGIPICWPVFGPAPKEPPYEKLAQHGFARSFRWEYVKGDDPAVAVFTLESNADIKKMYEPEFKLKYTVQLTAGDVLECRLDVTNPSTASKPLKFQALLHNYLRLPDGVLPVDVTIDDALTGLTYKDKTLNYQESEEERKSVNFVDEVDRIYANAPKSFVAKYGSSQVGVKIETTNLGELVTWNPSASKNATMADMQEDGWKRFVCLEPGHVRDFYELAPGQTWQGSERIVALSSRLSLPANNAAL